jgi:histidinol-phosphate phosphatase family protein
MIAVILAGGRGTRLGKLTLKTPKPLVALSGKPIIERQILFLKREGVRKIWILSGYLGNQIEDYVGDGKRYGLKVKHIIENTPLGTAGALKSLDGLIKKDFLALSADVILDIDLKSLISFHRKKVGLATIVAHPSDHPYDSDLIEVTSNDKVISFILRKTKTQPKDLIFRNLACASLFVFSTKIFGFIKKSEVCDIEKDIVPRIIKAGESIYTYKTSEYIKDVGTPERLKNIDGDILSGKVARLNKKLKRPAIFMDRDGVINREVDELTNIKDLKLIPDSAHAIKKINETDFLAIVITNQASIAKGFMTDKYLGVIHNKLETLLGRHSAKLDAIYYCPHHPEKGFAGEIKNLKINCNCRKPKTGLIKKAVREFNVDLKKSYFIGDTTVDAQTARNAGIKFIGVKTGHGLNEDKHKIYKDLIVKANLLDAINLIKTF